MCLLRDVLAINYLRSMLLIAVIVFLNFTLIPSYQVISAVSDLELLF